MTYKWLVTIYLCIQLLNGQATYLGDKYYELTLQGYQKYCFEQDYIDNEHFITRFTVSHLKTELTIQDRNKNIVFYRANQPTYLYSIAATEHTYYQVICISNLSEEKVSLFIEETVGQRTGDQHTLVQKNQKAPLEKHVNTLEKYVLQIISTVLQDDKVVKTYIANKQDLNAVSYKYGAFTLLTIISMTLLQAVYIKGLLIKKKFI